MNNPRILVVEDEALIAANLVNTLTSLGYTVPEPVATGEDAIRAVKSQKPDLVLMDIVLIGEMDGIVAAEKIREIADIPLVFLTAYTDDQRLEKARVTEPYGYIIKPANNRELKATIEMAIYKHALDRKLRESEEKYRTVFENTGTATVIVEESTIISLANKEFTQLTGFSKDDIEGKKKWTEFVVKEDLERMLAQHKLRRQNKEKALTHYDFRFITKSGDIRNIYVSIDIIPGTKKSVASLMDITERRRAEEALRESEVRYRELAGSITDIFFAMDTDLRYTYWNKASEELTGIPMQDAIGKSIYKIFGDVPETRLAVEVYQDVIKTQKPRSFENEYHLEGKDFFFEINAYPTAGGIVVFTKDITERKRLMDELRESEERYRILTDAAHDAIFTLSPEGVVRYVNSGGAALIGMPPEKIVGLSLGNLYRPEIAQEFRENLDKVISTKRPVRYDAKFWHEDPDHITWLDAQLVPQLGPDGSVVQVIGISRRITDRKQAELLLKRFNEELDWQVRLRTAELEHTNTLLEAAIIQHTLAEESVRKSLNEREVLLREIHHRVRNNLQIILSLISLQSRNIKDQKMLETMGEFQNRIMAMAHVHERMCRAEDVSRIDLSEIVTFMGTSLFQSFKVNPKQIRLNVEIKDLYITIDSAIPISLIINELISNSIKHAFPQGTSGEITIAGHREADTLAFSIGDTGVGMPKDLDWMRSKQSLGHRLVVGLVQQLNGTIELDRTTGTAFNIVVKEK